MENKNNSEEAYSNLEYIKTIMTKAEMGYEAIGQMFMRLAVAFFIASLVKILINKLILNNIGNVGYKGIFITLLIVCVFKICLYIIFLLLLRETGNELQKSNQEYGLWLFRILFYLIIICNVFFPITVIAVTGNSDTSDVFEMISVALSILICGVFLNNIKIRKVAYIYGIIPLIILTIIGLCDKYIQVIYEGSSTPSFLMFYGTVKSIIYYIYPPAGCLYITYIMKKEKKKSELQ